MTNTKECCATCKHMDTECYDPVCTHPDAPIASFILFADEEVCEKYEREEELKK